MNNDIIYGLSEISLYLSNIGENEYAQTIEDACGMIMSLREQESFKPIKDQKPICVYEDKINKCACGNIVNRYYHPKFCGYCGRELIWY